MTNVTRGESLFVGISRIIQRVKDPQREMEHGVMTYQSFERDGNGARFP